MATYEKSLQNTLRLADEAKGVELAEHVERLRASAVNSQISANQLRAHMRTVVELLDDRVNAFARHASEEYRATSRQLTIVAAIGILFGILAGYLIGQFGIVMPINLLKAVMEAFARNDLKADVPGIERQDELGDMARTVEVFKKNGLEVARLRVEQEAAEKRLAEQRKADMHKLANAFEGRL